MAQEYGAAQPIVDIAGKYLSGMNKFSNFMDKITPSKKRDTSWHDDMLAKANASFAKQAVGKKSASKRSKKRTAPLSKKRIPRKKVD